MCQNGKYESCDREKIHGKWKKHCVTVKPCSRSNVSAQMEHVGDINDDDQLQYEEGEDDEDIYSVQVTGSDDGALLEKTIKLGFAEIKHEDFLVCVVCVAYVAFLSALVYRYTASVSCFAASYTTVYKPVYTDGSD